MQHTISELGQTYTVFDTEHSQVYRYLANDFRTENPFLMLNNPKVVLDIGANIGMWAFWVAKRFPECTVYAIEPHPVNLLHLQAGAASNKLGNVRMLPCAVSNKPELVTLWMDHTNTGAAGAFNSVYQHCLPTTVTAIPLNTVFECIREEQIDHMKVDIEGMEFLIFEGFKYWDRVKSLRVEVHPFPQYPEWKLAQEKVHQISMLVSQNMGNKPFEVYGKYADQYPDKP